MISIPASPSGKPVKPLGVVWYETDEAYTRTQQICGDMAQEDYATWQSAAQSALDGPPGTQPRVKVSLNPDAFAAWCAKNRAVPNALARQRYAYEAVESAYGAALRTYKATKKPLWRR